MKRFVNVVFVTISLLMVGSALADLTSNRYAVVTNSATASDAGWAAVIDTLEARYAATTFTFTTSLSEVQSALATYDPHWVCFVMKPDQIVSYGAETFVREAHQFVRNFDSDIYGDAIWAILTGYDATDARNIARGPDTLWVRNVLTKTAGGWITKFREGDYFSETDTRAFWHKNPSGTIDTLVEPTDCTDTLVGLLNANDVDIMITSGHANVNNWQLHWPSADGEGYFYSGSGTVWGDPVTGSNRNVTSSNRKIYWGPGNCLIGQVASINCMVLGWIHSGNARLFCGYAVSTSYGYMGWGIANYFQYLQDRFTFPEAFFINNQALLFDDNYDTPGVDPTALSYDRDVVALYGNPKLAAKVFATTTAQYSQTIHCDTLGTGRYSFKFSIIMNENANLDRPAFQILPFEINPIFVTIDSTNAHYPTVTDDFVMMRPWYSGDDSLRTGERYYMAFTYDISDTGVTPVTDLRGWTHPRRDIAGSNYYPWGSTVLTDSVAVQWSWNIPTFGPFNGRDNILTGDVNGDHQFEVVTVQSDTLYIFNTSGTLLLHQYIGVSGNNSSYLSMLEDLTGDSIPEIGIGYNRTSYGNWVCRIYNATGTMLKEFTKTGSRDGGMFPYTVIGDDVIISECSGYSCGSRGPSRWDYATATELWQYDLGPCGSIGSIADIDEDGLQEIAWEGYTCHNGCSGHSTTDGDDYTIITDETGINVLTQIYGGSTTERDGLLSDMLMKFTATGPYRILSFKHYGSPTYYSGRSRIHIRNTSGTILSTKTGFYNRGWSFAWADMDGDGVQDIVCGNDTTDKTKIFVLDTLLAVKDSLVTSSGYLIQAICDIDGDGNQEILIANKDSARVVCLSNGLDVKWRWTATGVDTLEKVIVSDNDGDGKIEIAVLTRNKITVLEGITSLPPVADKGWTHPRRDIAGSNYYPWGSTVLTDSVAVKWTNTVPGASGIFRWHMVLSGDVNGDGYLELVTVQKDTLFIFSSTGSVLVHTYVGITGQTGTSCARMLEDVTGDSIPEIGIGYGRAYSSGGDWKTRIYSGTGVLLKEFTKTGSHDGGMYPVAIVGQNLIISEGRDYLGSPRGFSSWSYSTATENWQYDVGPHSSYQFSIADIDADGLKEMSWGSFTPHNGYSGHSIDDGDCYTIINDETGANFLTQIWPTSERDHVLDDMFIKFTVSGPYRLVSFKSYCSTYPGRSQIRLRNTSGTAIDSILGYRNASWSYGWADMNGDGIQEIVCGNDTTTCTKIFILDSLLDKTDSLVISRGYSVRAICDFDGDGDNEVIIANKDSATVVCLSNTLDEKWRWHDTSGDTLEMVIVSDNDNNGKLEATVLMRHRITVLEGGYIPSTFSISGNITFWDDTPVRPISNAFVHSCITAAVTDTTNTSGDYILTGLTTGNYGVYPVKPDFSLPAITAADALLALRIFTGSLTPNPYQLRAADVNGGGVDATDALFILRMFTGSLLAFPGGRTWCFEPDTLFYTPLSASWIDQNFIGILYGDINGSWLGARVTLAKNGCDFCKPNEKASEVKKGMMLTETPQVSVRSKNGGPNSYFKIPVDISDFTDIDVYSFSIKLRYDIADFIIDSVKKESGSLSAIPSGWSFDSHVSGDTITFGGFGTSLPLNDQGVLCNIYAHGSAVTCDSSDIVFHFTEFTDFDANPITGINLRQGRITFSNLAIDNFGFPEETTFIDSMIICDAENVCSFSLRFSYDRTILHADSVWFSSALASAGWMTSYGIDSLSGRITIGGASVDPLGSYCGSLCSFSFTYRPGHGPTIGLALPFTYVKLTNFDGDSLECCYRGANYIGEILGIEGPENEQLPKDFDMTFYPNPFNSSITILFEIPYPTPLAIDIFDITGHKINTLNQEFQKAGKYSTRWLPEEDISCGIYLVRATLGDQAVTKRVVYLK